MPKKIAKKPAHVPNGAGDVGGLLYPFLQNNFSRGVLIALVPGVAACVIARAPQFHLGKILGQDLPISFDAISLILGAPPYFLVITWLLLRSAQRSKGPAGMWSPSDIVVLRGLVVLLGLTALFLLAQFFLVLAPVGTCDRRPHFELLWTLSLQMLQAEHCMSSAAEINKTGWYYVQPVILQAWLNIIFVALSLRILWRAWQTWTSKLGAT